MTEYKKRASDIHPLTLDRIIDLSRSLLPEAKKSSPWQYVNHGVDLAYDEDWLNSYMAAYGEMHQIKCRAALQNLPFDIISNLEIIDWGCGQGLATVVLLEMLAERDMSNLVRKITLIEPSASALERAEFNVSRIVDDDVQIDSIRKYLPSLSKNSDNEITGITTRMPFVIHLFSNILDIPNIDIQSLSKIVSNCSRFNYVVCVGPRNSNSFRIKEFSGYFHDKQIFSEIDSYQFAYTSSTHHNITCRTAGFSFNGGPGSWNGENEFKQYADRQASWEYEDDYSPVSRVFRDVFPDYLLNVYDAIDNQLDETDHLFIRPTLDGDSPDIVLYRPGRCIAIIQICASNIDAPSTNPEDNEKTELERISDNVNEYAKRLIDLHMESLKEKIECKESYRSIVKQIVVCVDNTKTEIDSHIQTDKDRYKYISYIGCDRLGVFFRRDAGIERTNRLFSADLQEEFLNLIKTPWHSYREGSRLQLTSKQKNLIVSKEGARQKIKGHAGTGKTQVMAWRAVNAIVRTGRPVLVLTYNISLRNYIRFRLEQIPADFSWNSVTILNYHEFFNSQALNIGRKVKSLISYQNKDYFNGHSELKRYSAIFIDEVQDYERVWLEILQTYFLEDNGEFVVFGDKTQNIFGKELDETNEISVPNIRGVWNKLTEKIARFDNVKISKLSKSFAEYYLNAEYDINPEFTFSDNTIAYNMVSDSVARSKCGLWSYNIIKRYNLDIRDTVILAETCDLLREIESCLLMKGMSTKTTFLQKDLYEQAKQEGPGMLRLKDKTISRSKKLHFTTECDKVKLATIHSFKGWECDNVILFIQKPEQNNPLHLEKPMTEAPTNILKPEIIYTGITRARKNLFIINIENTLYDSFFRENV